MLLYWLEFALQAPQQFQKEAKIGLALGLILGFIAGGLFLQGGFHLYEFINCVRGDRTYQLLVEYHDGLAALAKSQATETTPSPTADQPAGDSDEGR